MFLTGFDSKPLNTLYVDKNLKHHGLIQAFSRTNRILNKNKSHGNIVSFRNLKKATDEAKIKMIRVPLRQGRTLHHDIKGRFDSGKVYLRSAPSGTGVIAGGPMRAVFEALGIQDIVAKSVGTSNPHNMVRATFEALKVASSPKIIAARRGLKINEITKRRKVSQGGVEGAKN